MNITASKIQYIQNNNVKTFKIPKEDRNINFKKWAYNDVIQYIKLNEQKSNKKSKSKSKKNVIKYAKLTTAKDNKIINGQKTLDQMKAEAIVAANIYGINSTEYKSIVSQITQYAQLILNKYFEDYIKTNTGIINFQMEKNYLGQKFKNELKNIIDHGQCYKLKNDKKRNRTYLNYSYRHHEDVFNELLGIGNNDNYHREPDEKLYFEFEVPNNIDIDNVIKKYVI